MAHFPGVSQRIVYQHIDAVFLQFADHVDNPGVPQVRHVFLEREAKDAHTGRIDQPPLPDQQFDAGFRHMLAHAVVDAPPGQNDLRMAAEFLGLEGQVVRIDADAVPADQPRTKRQEVPLGPGRFQHIQRINAEPVKNDGQLIHQRDVQVALRVLNDLGGFRNLDAGGTVDARTHDRPVQIRQQIQRRRVASGNNLLDGFKRMHLVAGVDPLRRIAHREVGSAPQAGFGLKDRDADLFGHARIDRGLVHDDRATGQMPPHSPGSPFHRGQIQIPVLVDRRRNRHDDDARLAECRRIAGETSRGSLQRLRVHFACPIRACGKLFHAGGVQIKTDHVEMPGKSDGQRQADIPEADDGHRVRALMERRNGRQRNRHRQSLIRKRKAQYSEKK